MCLAACFYCLGCLNEVGIYHHDGLPVPCKETFHWRLKSFNVLGHRFHHGMNTQDRMELHKTAVKLVASVVQYVYKNGHPPFDVCQSVFPLEKLEGKLKIRLSKLLL